MTLIIIVVCIALTISNPGYSYASIGLPSNNPRYTPRIYEQYWTHQLSYVCQYHSK